MRGSADPEDGERQAFQGRPYDEGEWGRKRLKMWRSETGGGEPVRSYSMRGGMRQFVALD